jgi:hypothetical protein
LRRCSTSAVLGLIVSAVCTAGMSTVLCKAFDPAQMWELVDSERITGFFAVPAMLAFMYQHPRRAQALRPDLRWILVGAAPVPVNLIEAYSAMGIDLLAGLRAHRDSRRHLPAGGRTRTPQGGLYRPTVFRHRRPRRRHKRASRVAAGHAR